MSLTGEEGLQTGPGALRHARTPVEYQHLERRAGVEKGLNAGVCDVCVVDPELPESGPRPASGEAHQAPELSHNPPPPRTSLIANIQLKLKKSLLCSLWWGR